MCSRGTEATDYHDAKYGPIESKLPEVLTGKEFVEKYKTHDDDITKIEDGRACVNYDFPSLDSHTPFESNCSSRRCSCVCNFSSDLDSEIFLSARHYVLL